MGRKRKRKGAVGASGTGDTWAELGSRSSLRQRRLFACAACRWVWDRLGEKSQAVVEAAERLADGLGSAEELRAAVDADWEDEVAGDDYASNAVSLAGYGDEAVESCWSLSISGWTPEQAREPDLQAEVERRKALLPEIVGPAALPAFPDEWLAWQGELVIKLAAAIYEERAWERMPILADALEEAGCTTEAILEHCRSGAEHVRGCWVLDGILRKEGPVLRRGGGALGW